MPERIITTPCPDGQCHDGHILVWYIYKQDPTKPEKQVCDICQGKGFLVLDSREVN